MGPPLPILDLSKLAADCQIARQTVVCYFEVLENCLFVNRLAPFAKSARRRLVQHPRFYFFDPGDLNGLLAISTCPPTGSAISLSI
jgi:predicted AAA+ superfamily ATPase